MNRDRESHSISDLTRIASDLISDYSYFDSEQLNNLLKYSRGIGFEQNKKQKVSVKAKDLKKLDRITFSDKIRRSKHFKKPKKTICVSDRYREKQSTKPSYLETERKINFQPFHLLKRYIKFITV